jgi:hypothetical protein
MSDFFSDHFEIVAVGFDDDKAKEISDKLKDKIMEELTNGN